MLNRYLSFRHYLFPRWWVPLLHLRCPSPQPRAWRSPELAQPTHYPPSFPPVTRIVRVIGQPRGNMLLVGIGGSGRQILARLASSICEYITFQIEVTKHYRRQEFREGKAGFLRQK